MADTDYVLGTYDEEVERLGLQHRVWRHQATEAWRRAQFRPGQKILDIGAGPGYATVDLAQIVGDTGRVVALELSERFVEIGRQRTAGLQVDFHPLDLVNDALPVRDFDAAWCRWVLSFVTDPMRVVEKVAGALRPGGRFVLHEYLFYSTWSFLPPQPEQAKFMQRTIDNWKGAGGDPDVGALLPGLLKEAGFRILEAVPVFFTMTPQDYQWQWPRAWIMSSGKRLVETGDMTPAEFQALVAEFDRIESDPGSLMASPSVVQVIAEKI